MAEESVRSSRPDVKEPVPRLPQQGSWTYINGEQLTNVWEETEEQVDQAHGMDQLPEDAEQWEQLIWPVQPMTCTSPPLSFATVQWDMPDPIMMMNDSSLANELASGDVTYLVPASSSSLRPPQAAYPELCTQQADAEEEDRFYSPRLTSDLEWTGNGFEPCDAADVQEPTTQEKEGSTQELLDEIPVRTDSEAEAEEGHQATADPVETADSIDTPEATEDSGDETDHFVYLKLEKEQEEASVLLTGQGHTEEENTAANPVETEEEKEEEGEVEEEPSVTNVSSTEGSGEAFSCLSDVETPAEPLQTGDTGATINTDKLIDPQQSELLEERQNFCTVEDTEVLEPLHEDPTGQTEEPDMCRDLDQNVEPEQSEAADEHIQEPSIPPPLENTERIESSPEIEEPTEIFEDALEQTALGDIEVSPEPQNSESQLPEMAQEPEQNQAEEAHSDEQLGQQVELMEESTLSEKVDDLPLPEESIQSEPTVCVEAEAREDTEQQSMAVPSELQQPEKTDETDETETTEQLLPETEMAMKTAEAQFNQVDTQAEASHQAEEEEEEEENGGGEGAAVQTVVANGELQPEPSEKATLPHMNGGEPDREKACRLAQRLFQLDGIQRVDVVKHLDKDNDFSRAVGEEYLKFFDFTGHTLDHALRSFLKVVVLIGETQERERVLQHFTCRFHQCNPESYSSSGSALALTCALMLLNTDLHGQNVGKCMSSSKFVSNLDTMNEGENFSKDLLKSLYNSIKNEPLEWAVDEDELKSSVLSEEDVSDCASLRSKANPFQDVPHDKTASVVKEGFLQRKIHADIDGKRTPWGKRSWKTFYGVLRGMVLYLQKDDYFRRDQPSQGEVVSVHHSLAEQAADYTKKPHVFRLQTADWRVFLFQASSRAEMNSWISRINLISALHSSPPFPAAVGSQRRFCRPILPASQSAHTRERQLQSHAGMLESFKADLLYLQQNQPEGKKAKTKELEEHRVRAEYLQREMCRYEIYIMVLEACISIKKSSSGSSSALSMAELTLLDKATCSQEEDEGDGLKKAYSSPSLELETPPPSVIKVRRNISERRTYRRTIIPRWNKEA